MEPASESRRGKRAAGQLGEDIACRYLEGLGQTVLARNWRSVHLEIDIVTADGKGSLRFVEVKTRTGTDMALPREYVTKSKQSKLKKTALFYLADNDLDCCCRFDVAEVYADEGGEEPRIEYIEDAFM